jgi:hypothetical protein
MIIDLDSHLREIYFMDEVYKLEGRYAQYTPVKVNNGMYQRRVSSTISIPLAPRLVRPWITAISPIRRKNGAAEKIMPIARREAMTWKSG